MRLESCTIKMDFPRFQYMSYTQLLYHIVLRTHSSRRTLAESHERELYNYMYGFACNHSVTTLRIGGMPDHVHLLLGMPSTMPVAKFVQELKIATSKWLKMNPDFPSFDGWTKEYAAFTVSYGAKDDVIRYIKGQKEHHKVLPIEEELRRLLSSHGVEYREEYFMKD